jgi:hypothetical protein
MTAYPRSEPKVTIRIGTTPDSKTTQQWAEFEFKTPGRVTKLPNWRLRSLPATNVVDGHPIVLRSASTSKSELIISLPSSEWSVPECLISDQEGNTYSYRSYTTPSPPKTESLVTFPDSFAGQPWRLRMQTVHVRAFTKSQSHPNPMRDFPEALRRRIVLSADAPPVSISNALGEEFSCSLERQQISIKGNTPARPYWALVSASNGTNEIEPNGYGWQNPSPQQPLGQQIFFLSESITHLTLELACPEVLSTEFYFQPSP